MLKWGNKSHFVLFALITALGACLRYMWIVRVPNDPILDFEGYYKTAVSFFQQGELTIDGEPAGYVGVMYPLLLGCFFWLVGNSDIFTAKVFNVIISTATLVIMFFILTKFLRSRKYVYSGYLILAVLPNYIAYNSVLGSEITFTFFFALTVLVSISKFDDRVRYPILGILCAVAALTRPFFLAYPAVLIVLEWMETRSLQRIAVMGATVFVAMALTLAPWIYRNYQVFGTFIPVSYNGGINLFINNNDSNIHGGYMPLDKIKPSEEFKRKLREAGAEYGQYSPKLEPLYREEAQRWIITHPLKFIQLGIAREKLTFFSGANDIEMWAIGEQVDKGTRKFVLLRSAADMAINVLSGCGLVFVLLNLGRIVSGVFAMGRFSDMAGQVLTINILFYAAIYFVFEGQARYNFPVLFLFVIGMLSLIRKAVKYDQSVNRNVSVFHAGAKNLEV